jgi:hypothetical protein
MYRWFRKVFYRMVQEEGWLQIQADTWHKDITPCRFCQRPIPTGCSFCQYCGAAQQERATESIDLSATVPMQVVLPPGQRERDAGRPVIITRELNVEKLLRPGERPVAAYNRMMKWRKMVHGD